MSLPVTKFDLKTTVSHRRLVGLWRMLTGFRLAYLGAVVGVAVAAVLQMGNALLLRYLVDDVLGQGRPVVSVANLFDRILLLVGLGFVALALGQGTLSFASGALTARTSEGVAQRLRNYLYDHIQRMSFTYHDHTEQRRRLRRRPDWPAPMTSSSRWKRATTRRSARAACCSRWGRSN